jgi:hypothetical protein
MPNQILAHLVVVGVNPNDQEWAIGLSEGSTLKVPIGGSKTIHDKALQIADDYLNVDERFLVIEPATFHQENPDDTIHLIFVIKIPQNIKLFKAEWIRASQLAEYCKSDPVSLKVIAEALAHG